MSRFETPIIQKTGFTRLSRGDSPQNKSPKVNIIFVHGLMGHPQKTWEHRQIEANKRTAERPRRRDCCSILFLSRHTKPTDASVNEDSGNNGGESAKERRVFWPQDYLLEDVPEAEVWTYGYNADVTEGLFQANNQNSVSQHGRDLGFQLERAIDNKAPIVFVAHSLGGIIVKDAIRRSKSCQSRTKFIVFLGTPHRGSSSVGWGIIASNLAKLVLQDTNKRILKTLEPNGEVLDNIHEEFVRIMSAGNIGVHSFQEAKAMTGVKGLNGKVVDDFSSKTELSSEKVESIDANHVQMAKCENKTDPRYQAISGVLKEFMRSSVLNCDEIRAPESGSERADVQRSTNEPKHHAPIQPSPRLMSNLPISTQNFFGRSAELEKLSTTLDPERLGMKGVILYGIGGAGKTQLALRYIQQTSDRYDAIFWINALTKEQILDSFTNAAAMMSESLRSKDGLNPYSRDNAQSDILFKLRSNFYRNWLLVLDSADDLESMNYQELIPRECQRGSVIISSTTKEIVNVFRHYNFSSIEIDKLDIESCAALLLDKAQATTDSDRRGTEPMDTQQISEIAEELDFLPLALKQGGILLRKKVLRFDNFVSEYRKSYKDLTRYLPKQGDVLHRARSISIILTMLYSHLCNQSPETANILRLAAILGPSIIPVSLIVHLAKYKAPGLSSNNNAIHSNEINTRRSLSMLEDFCLLNMKFAEDGIPESIQLHRSICQWVTDMMKSDEEYWVLSTASGVGNFCCAQRLSLDRPIRWEHSHDRSLRACIPMIDRLLSRIMGFKPLKELLLPGCKLAPVYSEIVCNFGYVYVCYGRYAESKNLLSEAKDYQDALTQEPPISSIETLPILFSLAKSHYKLGELDEAADYFQAAHLHTEDPTEIYLINRYLHDVTPDLGCHHNSTISAAQGGKWDRRSDRLNSLQLGQMPHRIATPDTSRIYTLTNAYTKSGKVLSAGERGLTLQMTEIISASAKWFLTPTAISPFYRLHTTSLGKGKSLDVVNENGTASVGLRMVATGDYSGQFWRFDPWSTGGGYRLSNMFTGPAMHLDVYSDDTLQAHLASGDLTGQHWTLNPAPAVVRVVSQNGEVATPSYT